MSVIIRDNFGGSGSIAGRTPDTTDVPGNLWSNLGSTYQGVWTVGGGSVAVTTPGSYLSGQTIAVIDAVAADVNIKADFTLSSTWNCGIVFNYFDSQNYWGVGFTNGTPNTITLSLQTAGSFSTKATGSFTISATGTYTLEVITAGDAVTVKVNGTTVISYSVGSRAFKTATVHGLNVYNDLATLIDNFIINSTGASLSAGTLSATIASATSINLSTTVATGGTAPYNYQFQRAPDVAGSPGSFANTGPNSSATTYTDTGLTTRTKYWYRCVVTDNASATANSNQLSIIPGVATHFYIANAGNDSNNGTSTSTPWQHSNKLNSVLGIPGDEYSWNRGDTFTPSAVIWSFSGTQGNEIVFDSYGTGAAPILDGGNGTPFQVLDAEFIGIMNLEVIGSGVNAGTGVTSSTGVGIDIYSDVSVGSKWRTIVIDNCTISGTKNGIYVRTPIQNTGSVVGFTNVEITRNTIDGIQQDGIVVWGSASDTSFGSGSFPLGNTTFSGVYIGSNVVKNVYGNPSTSFTVAQPIAVFNTSGGLVERNVIHDCGATGASSGPPGGVGALVILESDRVVCQWNEAYNIKTNLSFDGCAFDTDGGATNCTFQYNYSHDNDGAGYQTGTFSGSNPNSGNIFRHNISRNDCRKNSQGALFTFGGTGALFEHNTVYIDQSGAAGSPPAVNLGGGSGHLFYDNILQTVGSLPLCGGTAAQGSFAGNTYWPTGGTFNVFGHSTLAAWQGTGAETVNGILYGVNADPLLSSPTSGAGVGILPGAQVATVTYFDLQGGSPAIGSGVDLGAVDIVPSPVDFHGYPARTGAKVDIGACSYGAASLDPKTGGGVAGGRIFTGM